MSDIQQIIDISINATAIERVRILRVFSQLADDIEVKAGQNESDAGLAFTAAASAIRRVMREVSE